MKKNIAENMPKEWRELGERLVADCRVFKVKAKTFLHPDGRKSEFFINESNDWVQCAALTKNENGDNCIVMVNQYRFGSKKISLELPGGVIDGKESPVAAAVRELAEETGYVGENAKLIASFSPNPAIQNNLAHFVMIDRCRKSSSTNWDENEELNTLLVPISQLDSLVREGKIFHAIAINAIYFLQKNLSEKNIF